MVERILDNNQVGFVGDTRREVFGNAESNLREVLVAFFENAVVNTTIFGFVRTGTRNEMVLTTKMHRKGKDFDLSSDT